MQQSERLLAPGLENSQALTGNIQHNRDLLVAGTPTDASIRTALIIGGGAMRGVYSGGVVTALEELGLTETFDDVIGFSAGACTAAYFLAGQAPFGTTVYSEELASKEFINPLRISNVLNVGFLESVFMTHKPLHQEAIISNRSAFHIGVTDIATAKPKYIKVTPDNSSELVTLLQATSSVPGLTPPVAVSGAIYGDGVVTCKNPIRYAIDVLKATDILYIMNQPLRIVESTSIGEIALSRLLTNGYSPAMQRATRNRHIKGDEMASTVYDDDVRIGILCPTGVPLGRLTKDAPKLRAVARQARLQTLAVFN